MIFTSYDKTFTVNMSDTTYVYTILDSNKEIKKFSSFKLEMMGTDSLDKLYYCWTVYGSSGQTCRTHAASSAVKNICNRFESHNPNFTYNQIDKVRKIVEDDIEIYILLNKSGVYASCIVIPYNTTYADGIINVYRNKIDTNSLLHSEKITNIVIPPHRKFLSASDILKISYDPQNCQYAWTDEGNQNNEFKVQINRIVKGSKNGGVLCDNTRYGALRTVNALGEIIEETATDSNNNRVNVSSSGRNISTNAVSSLTIKFIIGIDFINSTHGIRMKLLNKNRTIVSELKLSHQEVMSNTTLYVYNADDPNAPIFGYFNDALTRYEYRQFQKTIEIEPWKVYSVAIFLEKTDKIVKIGEIIISQVVRIGPYYVLVHNYISADNLPTVSRDPIDCVVRTYETQCLPSCKQSNNTSSFKYNVNDISTMPENGGKSCPSAIDSYPILNEVTECDAPICTHCEGEYEDWTSCNYSAAKKRRFIVSRPPGNMGNLCPSDEAQSCLNDWTVIQYNTTTSVIQTNDNNNTYIGILYPPRFKYSRIFFKHKDGNRYVAMASDQAGKRAMIMYTKSGTKWILSVPDHTWDWSGRVDNLKPQRHTPMANYFRIDTTRESRAFVEPQYRYPPYRRMVIILKADTTYFTNYYGESDVQLHEKIVYDVIVSTPPQATGWYTLKILESFKDQVNRDWYSRAKSRSYSWQTDFSSWRVYDLTFTIITEGDGRYKIGDTQINDSYHEIKVLAATGTRTNQSTTYSDYTLNDDGTINSDHEIPVLENHPVWKTKINVIS